MLTASDKEEIERSLGNLLRRGDVSLLIGAGFSMGNRSSEGTLPDGIQLRNKILERCRKEPGLRTTLKDAYVLGKREIPDFNHFLQALFTVERAEAWQQKIFGYAWRRVYTTNIDNVLNVAHRQAEKLGRLGGDFVFFNYTDQSLVGESIGSIPVVNIHGSCLRLEDGFIFSNVEYAAATAKVFDWHRDLAAKALTGGLLVVGNQLDESDIDAYIADRRIAFAQGEEVPRNWIVMPGPDPIKRENYEASGYRVFDATAEEFFEHLFACVQPRTIADIVMDEIPAVRDAVKSVRAMTWFKASMSPVMDEIEAARKESGILRHFITGDEPEWRYIVQNANADTSRSAALTSKIGGILAAQDTGIGVLHVVGASGAGKTTEVRAALRDVVGTYQYVYELREGAEIDPELLRETISRFSAKSIFVVYSAAEFYYAVSYLSDHFRGKKNPFCLFLLEDRLSDYGRNKRQLRRPDVVDVFEIPNLSIPDATAIVRKIDEFGLVFPEFSELPVERRARKIVDTERGFSGDLLSALFSLTTGEHFEEKIHQDYFGIKNPSAREALEVVAIVGSLGFNVPLNYVAGFLDISLAALQAMLAEDLAGILIYSPRQGTVRCRHRVIASYYYENCVAKHGSVGLVLQMLRFLSRQFTVADIKHHPLPYRIYKEIVSYEFLVDSYFAEGIAEENTEAVYQECQTLFRNDGIFWMHYGRFYRKTGRLDEAIECFRTGLRYFVSYHTRHQLGVALLERYMAEGRANRDDYEEGIRTLDEDRIARGVEDAFPAGTMLYWLRRIVEVEPENEDAQARLKTCVNHALKYFKDDGYVREQLARHFGRDVL